MSRFHPVLAVLLLASLLANVLLAVRISRPAGEAPVAPRTVPSAPPPATAGEAASLREALAAERKKNDELRARVERLETDKKVLALETPGAAKPDKLAAFREKLRKLKKMTADPAYKKAANVDPDKMVELTDAVMEIMKLSAIRTKEPGTYADCLQAIYEVGLEGEGTALTPDQASSLNTLLQSYAEEYSRIPPAPAGERLLREVQVEGAAMGKVQALLSDAQHKALATMNMEGLSSMDFMSTAWVTKEGAAAQIAQQWSSAYQLDESQMPQAKLAAQAYVDAVARLEADTKGGDPMFLKPGSPEAYQYREQMVREQLAALGTLQASMTTEQSERLRTQTMKEIHIIDVAAQVRSASADK